MSKALSDVTTGLYIITATGGLIDAICFLALGGVFAEMMTGNLLLMVLSLSTGNALGDITRYLPAILAFMLGALLGGRLLRGHKKLQEWRAGFAVEWLIVVAATAVAWCTSPDAQNVAGHVIVVMLALAMDPERHGARPRRARPRDQRYDRHLHRHHRRLQARRWRQPQLASTRPVGRPVRHWRRLRRLPVEIRRSVAAGRHQPAVHHRHEAAALGKAEGHAMMRRPAHA
jgi:uncharacterized protein DUF1275